MKEILGIFTLFIMMLGNVGAQEKQERARWIWGPSLAYQYQEANFLKASFWGLTDLDYANYLRFDLGANMTWKSGKSHVIPELGVTYYLSAKGLWPFIKGEITPYTFTPKIGVGLFNLLEVGAGYGFELKEKKNLMPIQGFNFSIGLSLPLNYNLY